MDLTNLRQHHEELVNHMKNSGYSMSCIYMYKRQIREILDLDLESWTSYQDIYQYFVSISSNQKDLKWRRSVIGSIEYFIRRHNILTAWSRIPRRMIMNKNKACAVTHQSLTANLPRRHKGAVDGSYTHYLLMDEHAFGV